MGTQGDHTSSGSKSRDTRGSEPSQEELRDELKAAAEESAAGLSGDSAGEEALDKGGAKDIGSRGTRPQS
jgi:hypothetical protein